MKFTNKNIQIGLNVKIGRNVRIGDNTTIYDNVSIGENSIICNDNIIGEPLNDYYYNVNYKQPETIIGENSLIRSHNIIYAGCIFGDNFITGHNVVIREYTKTKRNCVFGTKSNVQGYIEVGEFCRFHSDVHICQYSKIGNYVFIYPFVVLTNDPKPPSNHYIGPTIGDYTVIATSSILMPSVKLGNHCLVAAKTTVDASYSDYSFIYGNPSRRFCDLRELPLFTDNKEHYPWPYNFERGMPWEGLNYDTWLKTQK
jgi:acyl-[acyl carrier protein]--UDP-N-acetylglucosamine O-acyltransferase